MSTAKTAQGCCSGQAAAADPAQAAGVYSPAVDELVAIGAAIACNCERCFKYHFARAKELGVTNDDMARAVAMAQKVKTSPARAILELTQRHLHGAAIPFEDATGTDECANPELNEPTETKACCCSKSRSQHPA